MPPPTYAAISNKKGETMTLPKYLDCDVKEARLGVVLSPDDFYKYFTTWSFLIVFDLFLPHFNSDDSLVISFENVLGDKYLSSEIELHWFEIVTVNKAPLMTPQRIFWYSRAFMSDGSSTKLRRGLSAICRLNDIFLVFLSSSYTSSLTYPVTPKNIFRPSCNTLHCTLAKLFTTCLKSEQTGLPAMYSSTIFSPML